MPTLITLIVLVTGIFLLLPMGLGTIDTVRNRRQLYENGFVMLLGAAITSVGVQMFLFLMG